MERPAIAPVGASGPPNLPSTNGMPAGHDKPNLSPAFLAQNRVPEVYGIVILISVLSKIVVALRFTCRRMIKSKLWCDDWSILAALISTSRLEMESLLSVGFRSSNGVYRPSSST